MERSEQSENKRLTQHKNLSYWRQTHTKYSSTSMKDIHSLSSPYRVRQELSAAYWEDRIPGLSSAGRF